MGLPDVILTARIMPAPRNGGGREIDRFVRYIQHRDIHRDAEGTRDLGELLAYVHHRDPTSPRGRMFDADGPAGDEQRQALVAAVARSNAELMTRSSPSSTSLRAAYRFILSPQDARGLNLQQLTRAAMAQLQSDAGALPPWIAGEHRNTRHPHVHIVMGARRETDGGRFRTLVITRDRLASMKTALQAELTLQRQAQMLRPATALRAGEPETKSRLHTENPPSSPGTSTEVQLRARTAGMLSWSGRNLGRRERFDPIFGIAIATGRLSRYHQREAERLARQRRLDHYEEESESRQRSRHR